MAAVDGAAENGDLLNAEPGFEGCPKVAVGWPVGRANADDCPSDVGCPNERFGGPEDEGWLKAEVGGLPKADVGACG